MTRVELLSALARRRRADPKDGASISAARRDFLEEWGRWTEITMVDIVRRHAERLVETHPIGAGDALQIGAAIVAARDDPARLDFVTFDEQQAVAAEREGFRVLTAG